MGHQIAILLILTLLPGFCADYLPQSNIIEHEQALYCGNIITTVSCQTDMELRQTTFQGGDSVALTDLLLYLDYREYTCDCLPEYTVDTEFGDGYGINLTEGYARHGDRQVNLTQEQIRQIRDILDRQFKYEETDIVF